MDPLLGRALLYTALAAAAAGSVLALSSGSRPSSLTQRWVRRLTWSFVVAMVLANAVMVRALLVHDFSVGYVAQVGALHAPTWVTIVSLWSSLEGSILFWGMVLAIYVAVAGAQLAGRRAELSVRAEGIWLACAAFFALLLAGPAQPFGTVWPAPADGPGPNPLLQNHLLMVVHPPFLYAGYVGMTIPFGLVCAALLGGRLDHDWLRAVRTWLLVPWIFLTIAIALGGWWSYEVLGWGGYWAWDPVENASLLPWLTATAAIHSAMLSERRGILKGWTVTLVLSTFLLTILGTFMTRSGVFNSVHSFTQSAIGPTILAFLGVAALGSLLLLARRIDTLEAEVPSRGTHSRETMLLCNNLVLVLLTFTVLLGTVFPLLMEAVRGVQMSVGRPYFDTMAVPLGAALIFLLGVGPALPWGRPTPPELRRALLPPLAGAGVSLALALLSGVRNGGDLVLFLLAGFALQVTLRELALPVRQRMRARGETLARAVVEGSWRRGRRRLGAYVAHAGTVTLFVAIAVSSTMSTSKEVQLRRHESTTVGPYRVTFTGYEERQEPNRQLLIAHVSVFRGGRRIAAMAPSLNLYASRREPIGTPAVKSSLGGDLYLSLLEVSVNGGTVGLLVMHKPLVGWIWASVGLMALGGVVAVAPARGRAAARVTEAALAPLAAAEVPGR